MFTKDYITYAIIAVGVFTFYMAVLNIFKPNKSNNRLKNTADSPYAVDSIDGIENQAPALVQFYEKFFAKNEKNEPARKKLALEIMQAGISSPHAIAYYILFQKFAQPLFLIASVAMLFNSFSSSGVMAILARLIFTGTLFIVGLRGAQLYVTNRRKKRQEVLTESFPEVLDLLLVCIESGLGLDAALNRVCKELRTLHPGVIEELDRTRLELTMLNDRVVALQNLADRSEIIPFKTLVSALIQTEKFGTSLTDTLRVLSEEQRLVRLYTAEQRAARIPVLITIPLILFIMPAFIMIILGPPLVKVINQNNALSSLPLTRR